MEKSERIRYARGGAPADMALDNCMLVNVLSGEVHPASVAVAGGLVVGIEGKYPAEERIDLEGRYLAPGFMDAHVHIESSMVTLPQFAAAVVPRGTTSVFTDCHEIANVLGLAGVEYILNSAATIPMDVYVMLPSCVPATPLETSGAVLEAEDLRALVGSPRVCGLGELMNFPGTIAGDPSILAKLALFPEGPVDGHAPGLSGQDLSAYIAAGPDSEHECTTAREAREKLGKGMYIFLREGTEARNLIDLLPVRNEFNNDRLCLCTDDRHPADLMERGHMDSMLEKAVQAGVPAVSAIQMATINTARRFRLPDRGGVAPGFAADLVVLEDLKSFRPVAVYKDGRRVASDGELAAEPGGEVSVGSTFNVRDFSAARLEVRGSGIMRVIEVVPGQIVTGSGLAEASVEGGRAVSDPARDLLKIAVVERHRGTGNLGVGFVRGFGLRSGALASSVAHDSHNVVVVGCSDEDMAAAVQALVAMEGGQVVVSGGKVRASLALPIAGLMSPLPLNEVAAGVESLNAVAAELGCSLPDPFMAMSFLALPVIPELKLTDRGLVDVSGFAHVDLFA